MPVFDTRHHAAGVIAARPERIAKAPGLESGRHRLGIGTKRDGLLLIPEGLRAGPAPLIVALHGAGGVAGQMLDFLERPAEAHGAVVLSPESRGRTWDVILGGFGPDVAFIEQALDDVFRRCPIDPERIAVAGFSDGASYALSLGLTNGGLFSDVLTFSPGFMAPGRPSGSPRVFISHGVSDTVLPIERCSRRLVPALDNAGYDVEYHEFEGGHIVPADMIDRAMERFSG